MAASLEHRGPDAHGVFVEGGVGIGMRRLSIIDLSPLGHQPMANEDGQIQVVYNGEIYNFRELRAMLQREGHVFRSTTDTEVLVHGYEHFGAVELAKRLEGMFAFAILDRRAAQAGPGPRPFRHQAALPAPRPSQLSFASEIRAFTHDGLGRPAVNPAFVSSYLAVGLRPVALHRFSRRREVAAVDGAGGRSRFRRGDPDHVLRAAPREHRSRREGRSRRRACASGSTTRSSAT